MAPGSQGFQSVADRQGSGSRARSGEERTVSRLLNLLHKAQGRSDNLHQVLAPSPAALHLLLAGFRSMRSSVLDQRTQYRVALAVSEFNHSDYCLAMIGAYARAGGMSELEIKDSRLANSPSPQLRKLLRFAVELLERRGEVTEESRRQAEGAGYGRAALLDVVTVVAFTCFANYAAAVGNAGLDYAPLPSLP